MRTYRFVFHFVLAFYLVLSAVAATAQTSTFEPQVGQPGKDVIWVPTSQDLVDRMLDMAEVTPNDFVIDLGSGDGRTVITAARRGARALGIEYNPDMVELSKRNAAREGIGERAQFMKADLFETDFSKATVITMFLLPDINLRLRPRILGLKPGTRIVSNSFTMGEWQDDETASIDDKDSCANWCIAHMWIVPARVEGQWTSSAGDLTLGQQFQMVSGTLRTSAGPQAVNNGKLRGDEISFIAGGAAYAGRVNARSIEGTVTSGGNTSKWTATRTN
jgi:SAM-dependent methyltransferase